MPSRRAINSVSPFGGLQGAGKDRLFVNRKNDDFGEKDRKNGSSDISSATNKMVVCQNGNIVLLSHFDTPTILFMVISMKR